MTTSDIARAERPLAARDSLPRTLLTVVRAEMRSLVRAGGLLRWIIAAELLGLVCGIGCGVLATTSAQQTLKLTVAGLAGIGPLVVLIVLSIGASNLVPREIADGTMMTQKYLVSNRLVLFAGSALGWIAMVCAVTAGTALPPVVMALFAPEILPSSPASVVATVALACVVPALTLTLVRLGALILRKGAFIVAVSMVVLVVAPMLAAAGSLMLGGWWSRVCAWLGKVMLGPLVLQAMTTPTDGVGTWSQTLWSLVGVLAWLVPVTLLAYRVFRKPSFGEV